MAHGDSRRLGGLVLKGAIAGLLVLLLGFLGACASPSGTSSPPTPAPNTPIALTAAPPATTATVAATAAPSPTTAPATAVSPTVAASPTVASGEASVVMRDIVFMPETITVTVGTTVTWTNEDPVDHTVTAGTHGNPTGLFDQLVPPNNSFSFTFTTAGTYDYYCRIHDGMRGIVVVVP